MDIAAIERKKYRAIWNHKQYRKHAPALKHVQAAILALDMKQGRYLYDFGIGTGRAAMKFRDYGLTVNGIDIAPNSLDDDCDIYTMHAPLWDMSWNPYDYGFCVDVMEHIPTHKVDESLKRISLHVKNGCYFSISTKDEPHGNMLIGGSLHATIKPAKWWIERLEKYFSELIILQSGDDVCIAAFKG